MQKLKQILLPLKYSTRFVTNAHDLCGAIIFSKFITNLTSNTSVHSSAETTIGCDSYQQFSWLLFNRSNFCTFIECLGMRKTCKVFQLSSLVLKQRYTYSSTLSVRASLLQLSFSSCILGSRHHLHGLGNFLNVLDRLQTDGNGLQCGHSSGLLLLCRTADKTEINGYNSKKIINKYILRA